MADYDIDCYFGGLSGIKVSGGYVYGYDLHADSRSQQQTSWRKQSVENNWVEGSFDVTGVRGNITELVAVWVYGTDANEYQQRKAALVAYLSQPAWTMLWQIDGMNETWDCTYSDFSEETQREFQYARQGIIRMSIMRRPRVSVVYSGGATYAG